jgi:uncharacterized protein YndB with AHSA1/START domain
MARPAELVLEMARPLDAPRAAVYAACTESGQLARWWGPRGFSVPGIESDLRAGGRYRIAMQPPEGDLYHLSGEFREVEPPERLSYTFNWEPPAPDDRETVVMMTFDNRDGSTLLTVRQEGFATAERLALHRDGWSDSLDSLQELLASE